MKIEYLEIDQTAIETIKPLWEQLRDHHVTRSTYFSDQMSNATFEKRKRDLINKAENGQLKIAIAYDAVTNNLIGYCISSINKEKQGEIDSIYIECDYRGKGVGNRLMERTLEWFGDQGIENIGIAVLFGNEQALKFYEKYGFYPRTYLLKNKD